ncbi:HIT family protein [Candidatus Micrarchaeota archaeon]|nr:HIT family protein [Candidatus Micrarchaeota archaeon]
MEGCVFCNIIRRKLPSTKIYEDDHVLAFMDIKPINPGHVLVIPKKHVELLTELDDGLTGEVLIAAKKIGRWLKNSKLNCKGINYVLADGAEAGQEIFHTHIHVIPRYRGDGFGFRMPARYGEDVSTEELEKIATKILKGSEKS